MPARKKRRKKDSLQKLNESYNLLVEVMENPGRSGWVALVTKIKPESREPIKLKLFDFKEELDFELKLMTTRILRKIGMDNLPNGEK